MNLSNFLTNFLTDGLWRGGAMNSSGTAGSTAVVNKGIRINNTAYSVGDRVCPNNLDTGAGGKFLQCTTAGTSQTTLAALTIGSPGATVADGSVTWTVVSGMPTPLFEYVALLTINKGLRSAFNSATLSVGDCISLTPTGGANGDTNQHLYRCTTGGALAASQPSTYLGVDGEVITDGAAVLTELSPVLKANTGFPAGLAEATGGSYARVKVNAGTYAALADWAGTQSAGSTTASTGTTATTSNNAAITFPTSTAAWGICACLYLYDQLTGGNPLGFGVIPVPQNVAASGNTPSFAISQLTIKQDS